MSLANAEELLSRFTRAETRRQQWDSDLKDAFRLAAPTRDSGFQQLQPAADRSKDHFDDSLILACRDSARLNHSTITPPHSRWFKIEPGPEWAAELDAAGGDVKQEVQESLDTVTERFFDELDVSNFHVAAAQAFRQERVSTGVLFFQEADENAAGMFDVESTPLFQVYPEAVEADGRRTVWRRPVIEVRLIEQRWPDASLSGELQKKKRDNDSQEVTLVEGTVWDWTTRRYQYVVLDPESKDTLVERELEESPWILFSGDSAPGEALGRGPALDVLADAKTADKVLELLLKNASLSVNGVWQADDDGVTNFGSVKIEPGVIIPKSPGSAGLTPLHQHLQFNAAQFQLDDIRRRMRYHVFGPELPPVTAPGNMTATESEQRVFEQQLIRAPELLRLWREMVIPFVRIGLGIMSRRGAIPDIPDNPKLISFIPTSPMSRMQQMGEILDAMQTRGMAGQVSPEALELISPSTEFVRWMLERSGGYPSSLIRSEEDQAEAAQQAQLAALAEQAAPLLAQAGGGGGPTAGGAAGGGGVDLAQLAQGLGS